MILKTKLFPAFVVSGLFILLFACSERSSTKNREETVTTATNNQVLSIDTFSVFPPEIDGCSCYFSSDSTAFKKGIYVYMNDYGPVSFLKINGTLTKFIQTENKEVNTTKSILKAKSDKYEIIVEMMHERQNGDETWLKTGSIKLSDQKGNTVVTSFYGECGC